MKKRFLPFLMVLFVSFLFLSCDGNSSGSGGSSSPAKTITITVKDDITEDTNGDKCIIAGSSVKLSVTSELPSDLSESSVKWFIDYVDKPEQIGSGKSITFIPNSNINLRYKIYAEINTSSYKGKSNTLPIYVAIKNEFIPYVKTIYKHIDLTDYKPGISVSVYGKDASGNVIEFNLFDGLAQSNPKKVRNTAATRHILGSLSKSFTAASIINAYCSGAADSAAAIEILKGTKVGTEISPVNEANYARVNRNASLHQVLTHTSGMGDFIGVELIADLFSKKFGSSVVKLALGVNNASYKFTNWEPEQIIHYILPTNNNFDETPTDGFSTKYSTPCYDLLGIIVQQKTGTQLNTYISSNFTGANKLNLTGLILAPQDITDSSKYKNLANPHIFRNEIKNVITEHTDLAVGGTSVEDIINALESVRILPKKDLYDFTEIISDVNEIFCKTSWCGGAMIGTSDQIAKWSFNISCKDYSQVSDYGTSSAIPQIVHDTMRNSIKGAGTAGADLDTGEYGYGLIHLRTKSGYDFIAHYGETVGAVNLMAYSDETNMSYVVFTDSVQVNDPSSTGVGIKPADLINDLCAIDLNK